MICLLFALWAHAGIEIDPEPVAGVESTITLIDDAGRPRTGIGVRVVHREGLGGEQQDALGLTDSLGRVRWTPADGGSTVVHAATEERRLTVGYAALPSATLTLLGVLALAGLGAMGAGLRPRLQPRRRDGHADRTRH